MPAVVIDNRKTLARRLYEEIFNEGNYAVADEILAEDCISHGPGSPPVVGRDGIKKQAAILRTAIPDLFVLLEDQLAEGDRVASRWMGSGTNSGTLQLSGAVVPPLGKWISFAEIRIDRFQGERIVESWFIPDRFSLWQQLELFERRSPARTSVAPHKEPRT